MKAESHKGAYAYHVEGRGGPDQISTLVHIGEGGGVRPFHVESSSNAKAPETREK